MIYPAVTSKLCVSKAKKIYYFYVFLFANKEFCLNNPQIMITNLGVLHKMWSTIK